MFFKNCRAFLSLWFLTFLLGEVTKYSLDTNALLYNSLAEQLTIEQVEQTFSQMRKLQLLGYLLIPILLFLKTHIVASVLGIGTFVYNSSYAKLSNR